MCLLEMKLHLSEGLNLERAIPFLGTFHLEVTNVKRLPCYMVKQDLVRDMGADHMDFSWTSDKVLLQYEDQAELERGGGIWSNKPELHLERYPDLKLDPRCVVPTRDECGHFEIDERKDKTYQVTFQNDEDIPDRIIRQWFQPYGEIARISADSKQNIFISYRNKSGAQKAMGRLQEPLNLKPAY